MYRFKKSHTVLNCCANVWHSKNVVRNFNAVIPFKLADIGEGIAEVELMKWFVKEGDTVKSFDKICEVQSDKATVEITSRYNGVIAKIYHEEGNIVKVGDSLLDMVDDSSSTTTTTTKTVEEKTAVESVSIGVVNDKFKDKVEFSSKVLTTPAVRKLAKENKLSLTNIVASGPKGRITKDDVLRHIAGPQSTALSAQIVQSVENVVSIDKKVPIRGVQRLMVKSMTAANSVPHLTLSEEVVFNNLKTIRNDLKSIFEVKGVKLSYMPLIIKATSLSLLHFPMLNASINSDASELTYHANHNIGVAMDTPKGLIVPVIKEVQNKSIADIASELALLQKAAANGAITESQLSGGTFSLSNIGSIGGTYAVPIIVVPQVVIGAFGRLQTLPRYMNQKGHAATAEQIESCHAIVSPVTVMNVSWSADHRVVDGATVARFSNLWKSYLENPSKMIADLR